MKYNQKINEYYNRDDLAGSFEKEDNTIGTGLVGAPACGDVMKLQLKIENDIIVDARILVFGCGSARASSNYAAMMLIGKSIEDALKIRDIDIADSLELPKIKLHCSVLAEGAIKKAIMDYKAKQSVAVSDHKSVAGDSTFTLDISRDAILFIKKVLAKSNKPYRGVKLTLEESGCGLSYKVSQLGLDADISNYAVFTYCDKNDNDEVKFFTTRNLVDIVNGTVMNYKEDGLQVGITFTNPKEVGKCGCGTNFKLEKGNNDSLSSNSSCDN